MTDCGCHLEHAEDERCESARVESGNCKYPTLKRLLEEACDKIPEGYTVLRDEIRDALEPVTKGKKSENGDSAEPDKELLGNMAAASCPHGTDCEVIDCTCKCHKIYELPLPDSQEAMEWPLPAWFQPGVKVQTTLDFSGVPKGTVGLVMAKDHTGYPILWVSENISFELLDRLIGSGDLTPANPLLIPGPNRPKPLIDWFSNWEAARWLERA